MTITRLSKDNYKIICCEIEFTVQKHDYSSNWIVDNRDFHIHHLCADLSEAIDYIDFIMLV